MKIKKFPVAWMTIALTFLTSADAVAIWTHLLTRDQATWVGLALALLTAVLGKATHAKVTPIADPRAVDGTALVRAPSVTPRAWQP
jgi:hypothetical protein